MGPVAVERAAAEWAAFTGEGGARVVATAPKLITIRGRMRLTDGRAPASEQVRSMSHWSPYDRVGVVNAVS